MPAATPVTTPLELMEATDGVALLHTPPAVALDKLVVAPAQAVTVPVIGPTTGKAFTVTEVVTTVTQPVIELVTV